MRQFISLEHGATLVELIVVMLITASLLAAITGVLFSSLQAWTIGRSRTELQQTARIAVDMMVRELRYAQAVNLNSNRSLTLILPRRDGATDVITYYQDDNGILRRNHGGGDQPVTGGNRVKVAVDFSWADASWRTITIVLTTTDDQTKQNYQLQTAVLSLNVH